jgi:Transcriptional regulator PadR-like family
MDPRLPLTPLSFQILVALADGPKHGYGILKEIEDGSGGSLKSSTGTLYLAIQRAFSRKRKRLPPETRGAATIASRPKAAKWPRPRPGVSRRFSGSREARSSWAAGSSKRC